MKKTFFICLLCSQITIAQDGEVLKEQARNFSEQIKEQVFSISDSIWNLSEASFKEFKTSELLRQTLKNEGFSIQENIAGYPTMFTASFGNRGPLIGILSEADADSPLQQMDNIDLPDSKYGHGAGHHLLGAGSLGATLVLKRLVQEGKLECRIKLFFSTAEGSLGGRVPMVAQGLFDNVDLAFYWHPSPVTSASTSSWDAIVDMEISYVGKDALKNAMVLVDSIQTIQDQEGSNLILRTKIKNSHFDLAIPNDSLNLLVRIEHSKQENALAVYNRLRNVLETQKKGSNLKWEIFRAVHEFIPNEEGNFLAYQNLLKLSKRTISKLDREKANTLYQRSNKEVKSFLSEPLPFKNREQPKLYGYGSDIGDVSWKAPLISFVVSSLPLGLSMRNWEGAAFMNSTYSKHAILGAMDVIVFTSIDYLIDPNVQERIRSEFNSRLEGRSYSSGLEVNFSGLSKLKRSY